MEMKFCQRWPSQVELDPGCSEQGGVIADHLQDGGWRRGWTPGCQPSSPDSRSTLVVHAGRLVTNTGGRIYSEI